MDMIQAEGINKYDRYHVMRHHDTLIYHSTTRHIGRCSENAITHGRST